MKINKRIPTALVLLVVVFFIIQYFSRLGFFIATQVVILASLYEFYNLSRRTKMSPQKIVGFLLALFISISFYFRALSLELVLIACLLFSAVYFVLSVNRVEKIKQFPASIALTFFGAFYLSFTLNHFNFIREEKGPFYVYFLLTVIFIGDTGAYAFGKLWGRHKLAPIASPRKTWEGSLGGIVFACLAGIAFQLILLQDMALWKAVVFAFMVNAVAQISDPLESLFKRAVGVKDSSNILPGHGGVLDRIDSLILATPVFYYFLKFFG